jgi:putative ABC transport system permease protein
MTVAVVTPNIFADLRADPMLGRTFAADEGGPEDAPVVVLSEATWRRQFGADPDIVNATIMLNGEAHTVVGVMPETFDFILGTVNLWIPFTFENQRDGRGSRYLNVTAWRRADVPFQRAQAELVALASRLEEEHPATNENWGVNVLTVREQFPSRMDIGLVMILGVVVGMALLIACANVASLLLAKTDARQKELAVRVALGAGRGRLVQQLLTESVVLAVIAGGLGTVLSIWGVGGLREALPAQIPRFYFPQLDGTVIAFSLGLSVLAGLTFGITPATQVLSADLRGALTDSTRSRTASKRKKRLRSAFVMAEFAMALTILIAAAVLTDMVNTTFHIDPGYDSSNLMTMEVRLPYYKYERTEEFTQFVDDLERELARLPGSQGAALTSQLPRTYSLPTSVFTVDGQPADRNEEPRAGWLSVSPDYLGTLDIALRAGRNITDADRAEAAAVVLVNQRLVDQFFADVDPLGRRITIQGTSREIVGVVRNVAQTRLAGFEPVGATVYFPMAQRLVRTIRLAIRTPGDPYQVVGPVQSAIWRVDPDQPISAVQTLDEFIEMQLAGPTFMTDLLHAVGLLALVLAAIGVYGVMAYTVSQQTNEIGIRMALGAKPRQVLSRVTRQGATLAGAGLLIGAPIAALITRAIVGLPVDIPGVEAGFGDFDVGPVLGVSLILAGVGLVACVLPARRATQIDPVTALREE